MYLADKLIDLRKKKGWSQEDLAEKLDVTRQSVSKWESLASTPDLEKIVKMSELFGVTTDYLLKEVSETATPLTAEQQEPSESHPSDAEPLHKVDLSEAQHFLDTVKTGAVHMGIGVALCIISPIPVILLGRFSLRLDGLGVGFLFFLVAIAVALFIAQGFRLHPYEYLEKEPLETEEAVKALALQKQKDFEPTWRKAVILGVSLCILAVVPFAVFTSLLGENDVLQSVLIAVMLALIAIGVYQFVHGGMVWDSFLKLLEKESYTPFQKRMNRKNAPFTAVYWGLAVTGYLAWSFITFGWDHTWIVFPIPGALYGVCITVINTVRSKREKK